MKTYIPISILALFLSGCAAGLVAAPGLEGVLAAERGQPSLVAELVQWVCDGVGGEVKANGDCKVYY